MDAGRIYNDILCGKMTSKKENNGRAKLQYKDVKGTQRPLISTHDLGKTLQHTDRCGWLALFSSCNGRRMGMLKEGFKPEMLGTIHRCNTCGKEMSRVVFFSHERCCSGQTKAN